MGMPIISTSQNTRYDAITDIIQSVALEQASLSHILNAEGEKLQCVLSSNCTTPQQIIETNESVRAMVESISKLELILQYKLSLFEHCLCDECSFSKERPNPHKSCHCACEEE